MEDESFDPFDAGSVQRAWPRLAHLREKGAVVKVARGMHYVTRYREACEVLRNTGAFSNAAGFRAPGVVVPEEDRVLGEQDPPQHTFVRRVVVTALSPTAVAGQASFISSCAGELLGRLPDQGTADLVESFTVPLPTLTTVRLLGFPLADAPAVAEWSKQVMESEWPATNRTDRGEGFEASFPDFSSYIDNRIAELRPRLGADRGESDLMLALMAVRIDGKGLTDRQLRALVHNLLIGGMTTTSQLLGNLLFQILGSNEIEQRARADKACIGPLIEESLRVTPPVLFVPRGCVRDTTIAGVSIKAGERVIVGTACANRDERAFPGGDEVSLQTDQKQGHLTFGYGPHFCVGAPMARLVARLGIEALLERYGKGQIRLTPGSEFENVPTFFEYGPRRVPVTLQRI